MNKEFTAYTVAVALLRGRRCYVSQRVNTANFEGKWQFAGGKLEPNENPIDGGVREVLEETGLRIGAERLRYVGPIMGDPTTYICYVYAVDLNEAEVPQRTEDKMTDWQLLNPSEILALDTMPGIKEIMGKLRTMMV